MVLISGWLYADNITVHNRAKQDIYVAIYYFKSDATRETDIIGIDVDTLTILQRPVRKLLYDRQLAFSYDRNDLPPYIASADDFYKKVGSVNIGDLEGDVFYIANQDAELAGFNTIEWNAVKPVLESFERALKNQMPAVRNNPYKVVDARIRKGNDLPIGEKEFLKKRKLHVKKALEQLLGMSIPEKDVPTIACIGSGGGYRSMLFMSGALTGFDMEGLLDSFTYVVGLSGSTWAIGPWISNKKRVGVYKDELCQTLAKGLKDIKPGDIELFADVLITKFLFDQPLGLVDLYGLLLANALFSSFGLLEQQVHLSAQQEIIKNGTVPMPIYTAIRAEKLKKEEWYEFTPFEVGGAWLGTYVPTWAFGRKFTNGVSINFAPEQSFGFLLGIFGSAFAVTIERLFEEMSIANKMQTNLAKKLIQSVIARIGDERVFPARTFNFCYGIPNNPLKEQWYMQFSDAGIDFNLPYPPVSGERPERKADIMIFMDASAGDPLEEFRKVEQYARAKNLKFPVIDYNGLDKKIIAVFKDEKDPEVPIVIYMMRFQDKDLWQKNRELPGYKMYQPYLDTFVLDECLKKGNPCNTFNFNYTKQEALSMATLGEFNVRASIQTIIDTIRWSIDRKKPAAPAA